MLVDEGIGERDEAGDKAGSVDGGRRAGVPAGGGFFVTADMVKYGESGENGWFASTVVVLRMLVVVRESGTLPKLGRAASRETTKKEL